MEEDNQTDCRPHVDIISNNNQSECRLQNHIGSENQSDSALHAGECNDEFGYVPGQLNLYSTHEEEHGMSDPPLNQFTSIAPISVRQLPDDLQIKRLTDGTYTLHSPTDPSISYCYGDVDARANELTPSHSPVVSDHLIGDLLSQVITPPPCLNTGLSEVQLSPETTVNAASTLLKVFYTKNSSYAAQQEQTLGNYLCRWLDCSETFGNNNAFVNHVNNVHVKVYLPDGDYKCRWHDCPRQGKGFNARYKMLVHIRTHTNERPHQCTICKKSFSRLENLKIHHRSHTGEKPYTCNFPGCMKAYSNSSDRFKHVRTHNDQKPYVCKMLGCGKRYTDPSSLRKHVRTNKHAVVSARMFPNVAQNGAKSQSVIGDVDSEVSISIPSTILVNSNFMKILENSGNPVFTENTLTQDGLTVGFETANPSTPEKTGEDNPLDLSTSPTTMEQQDE